MCAAASGPRNDCINSTAGGSLKLRLSPKFKKTSSNVNATDAPAQAMIRNLSDRIRYWTGFISSSAAARKTATNSSA
jgi:hypothetical protein